MEPQLFSHKVSIKPLCYLPVLPQRKRETERKKCKLISGLKGNFHQSLIWHSEIYMPMRAKNRKKTQSKETEMNSTILLHVFCLESSLKLISYLEPAGLSLLYIWDWNYLLAAHIEVLERIGPMGTLEKVCERTYYLSAGKGQWGLWPSPRGMIKAPSLPAGKLIS